jgi:parallel beta-helix repeat protein
MAGLSAHLFAQSTYYVASSGRDSNSGRSADQPFQSIGKINTLTLQPGDQVLFRRGDTFRGTLQIRQSGTSGQPIIVDAFGSGAKPVLAGSVPIGNWTNQGNNIWQADASALGGAPTGVYRNGATQALGRYPNPDAPNKGYLTIQSHVGRTQFTSREPLPTNFAGGEVVDRPVQWVINRSRISGQNGNVITISNPENYDLSDNFGFFIQDHPATLDQSGEWYYNPANKTLRIYDTGNPNGQLITATNVSAAVSLVGVSNVVVRNLTVTQTRNMGVLVENGSGITLSGLELTNAGEDGLIARGTGSGLTLENSLIDNANNNGATISGYQNLHIRGNTLRTVGTLPGRGKSGDGTYVGINVIATGSATIENNVLDQIGYNGITFGANTTVQRNRVSNFCLVKSDGGGVYIWNGNRQAMNNVRIASNIIFNGIGAPEGTPGGAYSGANGIFLDDCTTNVVVADNTVFNCKGLGIFLHGPSNAQVINNTSFNNGEAQLALNSRNGGCSPRSNTLTGNILVSRGPEQFVTKYESHLNDLGSYGSMDNNVYARPFDDNAKIRIAYNPGSGITGADLALSEWQSRYGKDPNSRNSPITYKPFLTTGNGSFKLNQTFGSNNEGWDTWGPYGNGRATWDNGNRLDGGSLSINFANASGQSNSYVLASKDIGSVSQGQVYLLTFDAVSSGGNKRAEVFLRQKTGSYRDLASRVNMLATGTRQRVEISFQANASEASAILVVQTPEDGQTLYLDNVQLQPATRTPQNPDDFIRLVYNDTQQSQTTGLGGTYRDARNAQHVNQITLAPFTSAVLFKEVGTTPPPVTTGAGTGLRGEYFNNTHLTAPSVHVRTDAVIDFDWGFASPAPGTVNTDYFSIRWTGEVLAPVSGQYTFTTINDDGLRMWVNGQPVISDWNGHAPVTNNSAPITLTGGQRYPIRVEYYDFSNGAVARLRWTYPGQAQQTIPKSQLFPASGARLTSNVPEPGLAPVVYPNPAVEAVQVRFVTLSPGTTQVRLTNLVGQTVVTEVQSNDTGEHLIRLPVQHLSRGYYLLSIEHNEQRSVHRVVLSE